MNNVAGIDHLNDEIWLQKIQFDNLTGNISNRIIQRDNIMHVIKEEKSKMVRTNRKIVLLQLPVE